MNRIFNPQVVCLALACLAGATNARAQTLHCQLPNQGPNGAANAIAATSDGNPVAYGTALEAIPGQGAAVGFNQLRWWGVYLDNTGFAPCGPPALDEFSVVYFSTNVQGFPGVLHAGPFPLTAARSATGLSVSWPNGDPPEFEYVAQHPAVTLPTSGLWVSVYNNTSGDCVWRWSTSPTGDGLCLIDGPGPSFEFSSVDLAYCVESVATGPGVSYCDCTTASPCGNPGHVDAGCGNSAGPGAALTATGDAIIGSDSVVLVVENGPTNTPGLFFSGPNSLPGSLFNDGLRCVGGSILRLQVAITDSGGNASSSVSLSSAEGLIGGETRYYQYWYRDVSGPCGGGSNTTNGYRISW